MILNEISYREFLKRYEKNQPFAIISAYSGDMDRSTNISNNKVLRKSISDAGYSQIRVLGHYAEDNSTYETMIVFADSEHIPEFLRFLMYFGKRFNQNGFVFVDDENNIWVYSTRTDSTFGGVGSKSRYGKFQPYAIENLIDMSGKRTYKTDSIRIVND